MNENGLAYIGNGHWYDPSDKAEIDHDLELAGATPEDVEKFWRYYEHQKFTIPGCFSARVIADTLIMWGAFAPRINVEEMEKTAERMAQKVNTDKREQAYLRSKQQLQRKTRPGRYKWGGRND